MPFGDYKDFADCVKQNQDKDNPEAYCGSIQHQVEGGKDKEIRPEPLYKRIEQSGLQKLYKDSDKKYHLAAYISSTRRDRDGDRFAKNVLEEWATAINGGKINLGQDHGHSWKDTLGVWRKGEVRQNPHGDDISSAKHYLFTDALLEDPDINKDVALLIHKAELGEQISLSIAANPAQKNWYDLQVEEDGSNTRVIKAAQLLKADLVGEPANEDARSLGVFLKHVYHKNSDKCVDNCPRCFVEKDFAECIQKSMIPQMAQVEKASCKEEYATIKDGSVKVAMDSDQHKLLHARNLSHSHVCVHDDGTKSITRYGEGTANPDKQLGDSSLVEQTNTNTVMTALSKEDQDKLNKEHGCKEGERYCPDAGKCMPDEETKSKLSPEVEKFIEAVKALATTPAPQAGGDPNGTPSGQGLEAIVQQALASMRAQATDKLGQLQFDIPAAQIPVTPGISGAGPAPPGPQAIPATPDIRTGIPIPSQVVQATPGASGAGPQPAPAQSVPQTPAIINPSPIPEAHVQASIKPEIEKGPRRLSLMMDSKDFMARVEKLREDAKPKQQNPGELLPQIIDTTKLSGDVKKVTEEYNEKILKAHAAQVKAQYTADDLVKMSERGELLKDLDPDNNTDKIVKRIANNEGSRTKVLGSILLTK